MIGTRVLLTVVGVACASLLLTSCTVPDHDTITTTDAWVRVGGTNAAGYVTLFNQTVHDDALLRIDAKALRGERSVVMEPTPPSPTETSTPRNPVAPDDIAGLSDVREVTNVKIDRKQTLKLEPGGYHVIFKNITRVPTVGSKMTFVLHFKNSRDVKVTAYVRQ